MKQKRKQNSLTIRAIKLFFEINFLEKRGTKLSILYQKAYLKTALLSCVMVMVLAPVIGAADVKQEITNVLNAGDTTAAIDMLNREIGIDPSFEANYYLLGQIYLEQNRYAKAEEILQVALDKNKKYYEGMYLLGKVKLRLNKVDEAEKLFQEGLKKDRKMQAQFRNGLGLVYMAQGKYNEADTEFRKAISVDDKNAEYYLNLGDANFQNKIYPLAITSYEDALEIDTASLEVYFRWAEACLELKDYSCALEKLQIVLQKDSTHADAWMRAGGIYYKAARSSRSTEEAKQRYLETIGSYKKYFELSGAAPDSTTGRAYYEAGMSYLILGGYEEALQNFRTVLAIPVEPRDIYFYYGRIFQGLEMYDSALVYFTRHNDLVREQGADYNSSIDNSEIYRRMGECYESLKDNYNTIVYYKKSLEYDSTQVRLLYGVAVSYTLVGDYRNALIYYMKRIALGVDDRQWFIYYNAATSALYLLERGGLAVDEDEDLGIESNRRKADPLEGVDLARLAVEYLEKINVEYWASIWANEKNQATAIRARGMLASVYLYQLNDCANGVSWYQKVLEIDPENCDAHKALGYAYFGGICPTNNTRALNSLLKALECFKKAGKGEAENTDLILWIAQTYHFRALERRQGGDKSGAAADFAAADEWYQKTLKYQPGSQAAKEGYQQVKFEH